MKAAAADLQHQMRLGLVVIGADMRAVTQLHQLPVGIEQWCGTAAMAPLAALPASAAAPARTPNSKSTPAPGKQGAQVRESSHHKHLGLGTYRKR
jgi:hypothetical protein